MGLIPPSETLGNLELIGDYHSFVYNLTCWQKCDESSQKLIKRNEKNYKYSSTCILDK